MASLRNIMNVEDDHPDSGSLKKDNDSRPSPSQQQHLDSTTPIPPYPAHSDLLTTLPPSQLQRGSSSSHALPSLTPEQYPSSASPGFSSSGSTSRRRSNTSTDSMDPPYIQGYAHMGSSASTSMRPNIPGASGPDVPLKLTPVTRKVSRAKKGVPVHICDQCRPPKPFTRAEHLRRHRLSHQPPNRACPVPGCDKVFHRQDLLERHQQRHEQDDKASRATNSPPGTQGYPHGGPAAAYPFNDHSRAPASTPQPDPNLAGIWQPDINLGGSPGNPLTIQSGFPGPGPGDAYGLTSVPGLDIYIPRNTPDVRLDLPSTRGPHLQIPEDMEMGWHDGPRLPSSASSTYSTPSDEASRVSGNAWRTHSSPYPSVPRDMHSPSLGTGYSMTTFNYSPPPDSVYLDTLTIPEFDEGPLYSSQQMSMTLVRSLSPQLAEVQMSETLVPTPSPLPTDRLITSRACGRQQAEACDLLTAKDLMPAFLNSATRNAIPAYLEVYWNKLHAVYPIIHKATFDHSPEIASEHDDVLRCAMASIATQFCDGKDDRIRGDQLYTYAWQKSKVFTQPDDWSLPTMQTVLLCEYYARFRGRKKTSHQPTARFELLFRKVHEQRLHALNATTAGGVQHWKAWSRFEALNRLLAACFILDVHTMCYFEQPSCAPSDLDYASPNTLLIPLSASTTKLWDANNSQLWKHLSMSHRGGVETVNSTFVQGLTPSKIAAMPGFDASVLLGAHALQLPRLRRLGVVSRKLELSSSWVEEMPMVVLFADSACANTYMALQCTPLEALLSVSGDSWVFNKKVLEKSSFTNHQRQLREWRDSDACHKAVVFAARALRSFLGLSSSIGNNATTLHIGEVFKVTWKDISDYWGLYVCTLICWAYGHHDAAPIAVQTATVQWIRMTADLQPGRQESPIDREAAQGVVSLSRSILANENLGRRNMLLADAVGVLGKLQDGGSRAF